MNHTKLQAQDPKSPQEIESDQAEIISVQEIPIQINNNDQFKKRRSGWTTFIVIVLAIVFIGVNLAISWHRLSQQIEQIQQASEEKVNVKEETEEKVQVKLPMKRSKDQAQHGHEPLGQRIQSRIPSINQRINLEEPRQMTLSPNLIVITNLAASSSDCAIINALSQPLSAQSSQLDTLFSIANVRKVLLFISPSFSFSDSYENFTNQFEGQSKIELFQSIQLDSDYNFVVQRMKECKNAIYFHGRKEIDGQALKDGIQRVGPGLVGISECSFSNQISKSNLEELTNEFAKHLYVFDSKLLGLVTPLSFAYYTAYTLDQMIIVPLLALTQNSQNLINLSKSILNCNRPSLNMIEYLLSGPSKEVNSLCFVSYPTIPSGSNENQLTNYLSSIDSMKLDGKTSISVIIYLPYQFGKSNFSGLIPKLLKLNQGNRIQRVKVRLMANKTLPSHSVYQSSYLYCPNESVIVSSRHNIEFRPQFALQISKSINQRHHYYHVRHLQKESGNEVPIPEAPQYRGAYFIRSNPGVDLYRTYFQHVQIFKSDLMKTTPFWILKSAELDFYETEAVFFIYMMECIRMNVLYINQTLIEVETRIEAEIEKEQIKSLLKYVQYPQLPGNALAPYRYNCLQNKAYRRFAPDLIERKIHQIWIGSSSISKIRLKLHETISKNNPAYQIKLWIDVNITRQNFPLTYQLVSRTFEYQKSSKRSYYALTADLLRYEILYQHGGIYIDFKMEVLKPLDPFLKYQIFFIDAGVDSTRLRSPIAVGVGIIGAMKNSYYFRTVLTEIISESGINYNNEYIPGMTGGVVVRKAFTDRQLFTVIGFGYHLFIPRPSTGDINDCGKVKEFQPDQQVFQIVDAKTRKIYKVGLPCKEYPQAYILSYKPLASSWKGDKRNMN